MCEFRREIEHKYDKRVFTASTISKCSLHHMWLLGSCAGGELSRLHPSHAPARMKRYIYFQYTDIDFTHNKICQNWEKNNLIYTKKINATPFCLTNFLYFFFLLVFSFYLNPFLQLTSIVITHLEAQIHTLYLDQRTKKYDHQKKENDEQTFKGYKN